MGFGKKGRCRRIGRIRKRKKPVKSNPCDMTSGASRAENEKELEINVHVKMEGDIEEIMVVKSDQEPNHKTDANTEEASESAQDVTIKTEIETLHDPTSNDNEVLPIQTIKTENKLYDLPEIEHCNAPAEFTAKCPSCQLSFSDYLQYLDHRMLCVEVKDRDNALEVKIETDEITEPYHGNCPQSSEEQNEYTSPVVKQEVHDNSYEYQSSEQDMNDRCNTPSQVRPQWLIQNTASEMVSCFYCNETFLKEDRVSYIQHTQKHLNKLNKDAKTDAEHEVKILNNFFRNIFTDTSGIAAKLCTDESCSFLFVDTSASIKHRIKVHQGYEFVCSKVDCHRVFTDKGSLRSHEIVDHTKIVCVYSSRPTKSSKNASGDNQTPHSLVVVTSVNAKPRRVKKDVENTCEICKKEFATSAELKSHVICDHPVVTARQSFNVQSVVSKVTKGVKKATENKVVRRIEEQPGEICNSPLSTKDERKHELDDELIGPSTSQLMDDELIGPSTSQLKGKSSLHCCVPLCNSDSRYDDEIHFHKIPKDELLKKQWIVKIRRDEGEFFKISKNTLVCSKHFKAEDYTWTPVRKCLKPDAVPSVFDWSCDKSVRRGKKRKILREESFEAIDTSFHGHICPYCGVVFKTASGLRKHNLRKHEQQKMKFKCPTCLLSFIDNGSLTEHRRSIHDQPGVVCELCSKSFVRKSDLKRHLVRHTDTNINMCADCGITFNRKDSMDDHRRAHYLQYKYVCSEEGCGARYKWRTSLSKHRRRKHCK